ncbi:unnamed protein product [Rotaria magnacalcarata]|uniref:HAT C-terminal dimerisation domain-containing protein n=1 Tax=Rotaria magnacalcarata TaxID=392030 RepID=A0A816MAQ4_9BILA|nr:unnamed protein product [Rotaria magnacalcarata]CAF5016712.1 unnamed protein product [Rotaria magnacalcarata]
MRIKTNEYFTIFYEGVRGEAKLLTNEPSLPRTRKPPSRFVDSLPTSLSYESIYDLYHDEYFEIINNILNSLDSRFKQSIFPLLCKVEQFILSTANGTQVCDYDAINIINIDEFLTDDINVDRLNLELMMLPDYFSRINKEKKLGLKKITKISTVCELLNAQQLGKSMFYEYCKLITSYLTVPATTVTVERAFSVLNRIKAYLRCTMSQQRLNHAIIPHIHKDKLDLLDLKSVCADFISKNENRKTFFGTV